MILIPLAAIERLAVWYAAGYQYQQWFDGQRDWLELPSAGWSSKPRKR